MSKVVAQSGGRVVAPSGVTLVAYWWLYGGSRLVSDSVIRFRQLPINSKDEFPKSPWAPYEVSLKISSITRSEWAYRATGDRSGAIHSTPDGGKLFLQTGT